MSLHDIWRGDVMPLSGIIVAIGRNSFDPPAPVVPCFDVHARELDLHDASVSGIIAFDSTANHLLLNPSTSGAVPICTAVYIDVYNSNTQDIGNITIPSTVPLNTVQSNSSSEYFTLSNSQIHVWAGGSYEITLRISCNNAFNVRFVIRGWLERSTAGGAFTEIAGTRIYAYARLGANGEDTGLCTLILQDVLPGDIFRLRAASENTAGTPPQGPQVEQGGCGLTFEKLE